MEQQFVAVEIGVGHAYRNVAVHLHLLVVGAGQKMKVVSLVLRLYACYKNGEGRLFGQLSAHVVASYAVV